MEITGNRNAIRQANAMATTARRLFAGQTVLDPTIDNATNPAERISHAILSASSKSLLYTFSKMPPLVATDAPFQRPIPAFGLGLSP